MSIWSPAWPTYEIPVHVGSISNNPVLAKVIDIYREDSSFVLENYSFVIRGPGRPAIDSRAVGQSPLVRAVDVHHVNLPINVTIGNKRYPLAVGRPDRRLVAEVVFADVVGIGTITIHGVDLALSIDIRGKDNLRAVGRKDRRPTIALDCEQLLAIRSTSSIDIMNRCTRDGVRAGRSC